MLMLMLVSVARGNLCGYAEGCFLIVGVLLPCRYSGLPRVLSDVDRSMISKMKVASDSFDDSGLGMCCALRWFLDHDGRHVLIVRMRLGRVSLTYGSMLHDSRHTKPRGNDLTQCFHVVKSRLLGASLTLDSPNYR
jgi:hypothetical protein